MKTLTNILKNIAGAILLVGVLIAFVAVIARRVFNNSIIWSEEFIRYSFIWMFFLAMPICTLKGSHLTLDLIPGKLHGQAKKILTIVIELICIAFDIVLVRLGFPFALGNMKQSSAALHIPYGYINMAIPVGACLMAIFSAYRIYQIVKGEVDLDNSSEETGVAE